MLKRRYSAISKRTRTLVFTDLDGALLDYNTYSWEAARPALEELRRRRIPLIFCTSKTRTEVKALRRTVGNSHPFVIENGGAIVIPAGYFRQVSPFGPNAKAFTLIMGRPYDEVVRELRRIAHETRVEVRGFHQMSDDEVARETGLSRREAHMARQRETGEPFVFRSGTQAGIRNFCRRAQERGYSVQRGGRFWHFSGASDKGLALSVLIGFYRVAWQTRIVTVALGDGGNDISMLRLVDRPVVIPRVDGSYPRDVIEAIPNVTRAKQPGPAGWNLSVLKELQKSPAKHAPPQNELNRSSARYAHA